MQGIAYIVMMNESSWMGNNITPYSGKLHKNIKGAKDEIANARRCERFPGAHYFIREVEWKTR